MARLAPDSTKLIRGDIAEVRMTVNDLATKVAGIIQEVGAVPEQVQASASSTATVLEHVIALRQEVETVHHHALNAHGHAEACRQEVAALGQNVGAQITALNENIVVLRRELADLAAKVTGTGLPEDVMIGKVKATPEEWATFQKFGFNGIALVEQP